MIKFTFKKLIFFTILLFSLTVSLSTLAALTGDVNRSGNVDIVDALMTAQYYVGLSPQGFDPSVADVNGDSKISIIDALIIAQYYVGLVTVFPADSSTTPSPISSTPSPAPRTGTPMPMLSPTPGGTYAPTSLPVGTPPPGGVTAPPSTVTQPPPQTSPTPDPAINFFYFSYDDSASTAAVDLVKYRLKHDQTVDPGLARPWEFLNYETFTPTTTENTGLFDLSMSLWERPALDPDYQTDYKLGVYIASPTVNKETRKNLVMTVIVDISGSMGATTLRVDDLITSRMDIVKYGLNRMAQSLKAGDVINVVTFDTTARIVRQGLTYENDLTVYLNTVDALSPTGTTNLSDGINKGYQAALATFDPAKTNRVIILTDAYANTGTIDTTIISKNIVINNQEGIFFSGLGISADFNEAYLNELVEAGKGAYFTLVTLNDAARAFEDRFSALVTVAAKEVQFRLDFPMGLIRDVTASEETSTNPVDVQPTNFSFNTSQYFFEGFKIASDPSFTDETFKLTISYRDPESGDLINEIYEKPINELLGADENCIRDAEIIFLFTELFGQKKSAADINQILKIYYATYSSPLFDEYLDLIHKYIGSEFTITPQTINFGTAMVGERFIKQITVTNNTLETITISGVFITDFTSTNPNAAVGSTFDHTASTPVVLEPLDSYALNTVFNADWEGTFTANLNIQTDQTTNQNNLISLRGMASANLLTPPPPITPTPPLPPLMTPTLSPTMMFVP